MAKILIVDDDLGVRTLVSRLLMGPCNQIVEAENGVKALEALEESDFDLILSDLRMPYMHGIALLQRVKQRQPAIPFVLITAYASAETMAEAVDLGVFDYLAKPFKTSDLFAVVHRALTAGPGRSRATDGYAGNNPMIIANLAKRHGQGVRKKIVSGR